MRRRRLLAQSFGVPNNLLRTPAAVAKLRKKAEASGLPVVGDGLVAMRDWANAVGCHAAGRCSMKAGIAWLLRLHGRRRARRVAEAYRQRLDGEDVLARFILSDLAQYCRAGQSSFVPGDPHQTAFNEGARDVFLHRGNVRADPCRFCRTHSRG